MVSWRCTSRITRDFRKVCNCAIFRARMASCMRWRSTGCSAEKMKNSQNRSPMLMMPSGVFDVPSASRRSESEDPLVGLVQPVMPLRADQQRAEHEARDEAADMGPPGDPGSARRREQLHGSLQKLHEEPQPGEHECGKLEKERQKQDRDNDDDARHWEQPHVASKHAGDRPGGAERRD